VGKAVTLIDILRQCADADEVGSIICLRPWGAQSPAALVPPELSEEIINKAPHLHFCEIFAIKHFFGDEVFDVIDDGVVERIIYFAENDA
jgi:hypothetical protein